MSAPDHAPGKPPRPRRRLGAVVGAALAITIAAPVPTSASSSNGRRPLERLLVELWTDVLETPAADNPFATPGADACWEIGPRDRIVSPFSFPSVDACTVKRGTPLFVVVTSLECSDVEENGETIEELAACAETLREDTPIHELRVDGRRFPVAGVETDAFNFTVPEDSLFPGKPMDVPGTIGTSVAFGWVALVPPLSDGTHVLTMRAGADTTTAWTVTIIRVTRS